MKKELGYTRNRYKKQNKRYITKYGVELREEILLDKKLEDVLNIELYCYNRCLRDEYGSAVKIMNHIELNVGFDRFKEIVNYCLFNNINRGEFIEFMNNNDKVIPEIIDDSKDGDKKLTVDYFYLVCAIVNLIFLIGCIVRVFNNGGLLYMVILLINSILGIIFLNKTFKYEKI